MHSLLFFWLGLVLFFWIAIKLRMRRNLFRQEQSISSPLSEALQQLLGISGGIYLSLTMLLQFLGISSLPPVLFGSFWLDPLALLSVLFACIQPCIFLIFHWLQSKEV